MAPPPRWPREVKAAAVQMLEAGRSPQEVAAEVGATARLVNAWRASWRPRVPDAAERQRQEQLDQECRRRMLALIALYDRRAALRAAQP